MRVLVFFAGMYWQGVDEGAKGIVLKTAECSPDRYA